MIKTINDITIEYDKKDQNLAEEIMWTLEEKKKKILDFFGLEKIKPLKIKVWDNYEDFKAILYTYLKKVNRENELNFVTAHTFDGKLNMLPARYVEKIWQSKVEDREIAIDACHEFVHICQQNSSGRSGDQNGWFWEALATNLGNPESFEWVKEEYDQYVNWQEILSVKELNEGNKYKYDYLIGRYMLDKIPYKKVMEYIKNPDILEKDGERILASAKKYSDKTYSQKYNYENKKSR